MYSSQLPVSLLLRCTACKIQMKEMTERFSKRRANGKRARRDPSVHAIGHAGCAVAGMNSAYGWRESRAIYALLARVAARRQMSGQRASPRRCARCLLTESRRAGQGRATRPLQPALRGLQHARIPERIASLHTHDTDIHLGIGEHMRARSRIHLRGA